MIDWIKQFFVTKGEDRQNRPKCILCGLGAKYHMLIEFQKIGSGELDNKILIKICGGCYEEVYERYNPEGRPPPIQSGVFESQLGFGKEKNKTV